MTVCLMLHGLGDPPAGVSAEERPYWVSQGLFDGILDLLRTEPAQITIDDGNVSDIEIALPRLLQARLPATFFIPSDRVGTKGYLGEGDVRTLYSTGMEVGSHGCAHLRWTAASDGEIARDVTRSIERLSAIISAPVRSVALPYGDCDRRVLRVLRSLGIGKVYTSFRGPGREHDWLVRRDCVMADTTLSDVKALLTAEPTASEAALSLLRIWRHTGRAAVLRA